MLIDVRFNVRKSLNQCNNIEQSLFIVEKKNIYNMSPTKTAHTKITLQSNLNCGKHTFNSYKDHQPVNINNITSNLLK